MKRKKLTASMIALVMSVSLPMTTYAANWYLEDGSVTVNADNSGQTVTQGSSSAVPDEAPDFSVCSLFKKLRKKEGGGCSLCSEDNPSHTLFSERFDVLHFSRQHGKIGIRCNCQHVFLLRSSKNHVFSVLTYYLIKMSLYGSLVSCAFSISLYRL